MGYKLSGHGFYLIVSPFCVGIPQKEIISTSRIPGGSWQKCHQKLFGIAGLICDLRLRFFIRGDQGAYRVFVLSVTRRHSAALVIITGTVTSESKFLWRKTTPRGKEFTTSNLECIDIIKKVKLDPNRYLCWPCGDGV